MEMKQAESKEQKAIKQSSNSQRKRKMGGYE
jgi:hypothetical protein